MRQLVLGEGEACDTRLAMPGFRPKAMRFGSCPPAVVIGRVKLERDASVWWNALLRSDNDLITIGQGSNIQDGCVLHTGPGYPLTIGADVSGRSRQIGVGHASCSARSVIDFARPLSILRHHRCARAP
jgi:carbonic anhydrase/acetyltransferase-like protein (isoleucine patch superfamily)